MIYSNILVLFLSCFLIYLFSLTLFFHFSFFELSSHFHCHSLIFPNLFLYCFFFLFSFQFCLASLRFISSFAGFFRFCDFTKNFPLTCKNHALVISHVNFIRLFDASELLVFCSL